MEQNGCRIVVDVAAVEVHDVVVVASAGLAPPELGRLAFRACFVDMPRLALAISEVVSQPGHTSYIGLTIESEEAPRVDLTSDRLSNSMVPSHLSSVLVGAWPILEVQDVKIVGCRGSTAGTMTESHSTHMTDILGVMISSYSEQNMDFGCYRAIS